MDYFLKVFIYFQAISKNNIVLRLTAVLMITALLLPMVLIGNFGTVNAQDRNISSSSNAPIAAPPLAYKVQSSEFRVQSFALAKSSNFASMSNSVSNYFSAPVLPEGFEQAKTVSPFYKDVSAITGSIGSFLGFYAPSSSTTSSTATATADLAFPAGSVPFDFDFDSDADVSRWNPSSGEWKVQDNQGNFSSETLGTSASVIVPGDFDGDGKTDKAVFINGTWTIRRSSGGADIVHSWGTSGDIPVTGDFDGDGHSDYAVFRPSTNVWWVKSFLTGTESSASFGATGDIPVQGDYDGDGITDKAVFRPSTGVWHISGSSVGYFGGQWGNSSDTPVPADFNGDGKTDFGIFRSGTGTWYINYTDWTTPPLTEVCGNYGDQPVAADYDADGKADLSVWRPKTGVWLIKKSSNGTYKYETLGMNGDIPVPAAYLKKVGANVAEYDFAKLRLQPINSTGGTDLYSRNFAWGTGLVGLSGRAGLDAGFGISYNSLVWIKDEENETITFDPDYSNVTPGFRMGFPTIETVYWDKNNGRYSYLMMTPSGARVEFQQIGATNVYETTDSSYVQLKTNGASNPNDPVENISITVSGTDGTQMKYQWKAGAFRINEIKDRNGNYITINHDSLGLLRTVTDTLGRVITVNYDNELYPTTITQNWKTNNGSGSNTTHTYATLTYTTKQINPSFHNSLTVFGPTNNTTIKVLDKITYSSGAFTQFEYNNFGQVWKVNNHAIDGHKLSHTSVNLQNPSANQMDVPRFSETRSWVENFNLDQNGNAQETVYTNTFQTNQSYNTPAGSGTGTLIQVAMQGHPTSNTSKTFVGETDWMESLPIVSEDFANSGSGLTRKRWSWTNWTQDDTNLEYIKNPRVTESKVGDDENNYIRRTTTDYKLVPNTTIAEYGLVERVKIYDSNQTTILKQVETDYNLSSIYTSKRIIGLPSETRGYGYENSSLNLVSKVTYNYDEENFSQETNQIITPIQHDTTNYGSTFIVGRANLTSQTRWNVEYPNSSTEAITGKVRYDIAGSPVASISPDPNNANGRKVRVEYTDSFNDTPSNKNTFAYPTKVYDPANNYSEVKYRYDIGANVWAKSPAPAGNTNGKETTRLYDSLGRLEKETLVNNGAYTKYEYPTSNTYSKVFTTINDTNNNNTGDTADEVLAESWTDGAGRTLKSRTEHPNSTGGYSGGFVEYNILGQVKRSTTPTEINSSWQPTGDDANNPNFLWTQQEYDWKGRVTKEINTDGTDRLISYEGCGCAGGQVTTIESELVPRDDIPTQNARRKQKVYSDILGRTYKTEIMNWDGTSVYTTTTQTFSGRDQVTKTRQYAGAESSNTFQDVTMTYDGHGRLKTRHYPIEDVGANTEWIYNNDDSIQQIIDPRLAITNFTYNNLGLTTQISYNPPPNINIPDTPTVQFQYDNLGNRTQMTDGTGTTDYTYDELSRMTSESKYFTALPNAPVPNNKYTISYNYNLSSSLKNITDPFSNTISYKHDKIGRLTEVDGTTSTYNPTGDYANNIKYRAFGGIKQIDYQMPFDTSQIKMEYDDRLRVDYFEATSNTNSNGFLMKADYNYFADSRTQSKNDLLDDKFDRTNKYDFAGRLTFNQFGMGINLDNQSVRVYEQTINYDGFSMMTARNGFHWGNNVGFSETYQNGRIQNQTGLTYDAAGNIAHTGDTFSPQDFAYTDFDVAGRRTKYFSSSKGRMGSLLNMITEQQSEYLYDGDGRPVREKFGINTYHQSDPQPPMTINIKAYQIWSSVLGKSLTELQPNGEKYETRVFAGGALIAKNYSTGGVAWETADPVTGTEGKFTSYGGYTKEHEPLGQEVLQDDPADIPTPPPNESVSFWADMEWQCEAGEEFYGGFSGMPFHCQQRTIYDQSYEERKNPLHIPTGVDSPTKQQPVPDGNTPTQKPGGQDTLADGVNPGSVIPKASEPDNDPESEENKKLRKFVVSVSEPLDMSEIPDFQDASQSGLQNQTHQQKIDTAIDAAKAILSDNNGNNSCALFLGGGFEGKKIPIAVLDYLAGVLKPDTIRRNLGVKPTIGISMTPNSRIWEITNSGGSYGFNFTKRGYLGVTSAVVNDRGAFLTNESSYDAETKKNVSPATYKGFAPDTLGSRIFQLFHEVGHLVIKDYSVNKKGNKLTITPLLPVDGDDSAISDENNGKVAKACKRQIENYLNPAIIE